MSVRVPSQFELRVFKDWYFVPPRWMIRTELVIRRAVRSFNMHIFLNIAFVIAAMFFLPNYFTAQHEATAFRAENTELNHQMQEILLSNQTLATENELLAEAADMKRKKKKQEQVGSTLNDGLVPSAFALKSSPAPARQNVTTQQ